MAEPTQMPPIGHARHDPLRVSEAVDRGGRMAPVLRFCEQCGRLYADLVALSDRFAVERVWARGEEVR